MKDDIIPDENHIARLCKSTTIDDGKIQASAFFLRNIDIGLSVDWLEKLNCPSREEEIDTLRDIYEATFNSIGAKAKIAILNVGNIRTHVRNETMDNRILDVIHSPFIDDDENDTHSEIRNMRPDEEMIAE